jgi:hypothetical protein
MNKPTEFFTLSKNKKDKFIQRNSNDEIQCIKWKVKYGGEVYIDTRYKARLRLYNCIVNKGCFAIK